MPSIRSNIILNGLNTITGIIFPIITFPYAARILLPQGIGIINFQLAIINYIVLLTSLGIPLYGVKEIAKHQDNKLQRDKVTIELLVLSFLLCFLGYLIVWMLASFVPEIRQHAVLFWILSLTIAFNTLGVSWFYQGVEDFKFITVRAIVIRTLSAASLFIFVRNSSDLIIYGIIIVCSTVGNNIINFIHLRKYLRIDRNTLSQLQIVRHIRPALKVFVLNLIISLYVQLNSIMLGFMSSETAVGYFTAGNKIIMICLTLIGSITTVLLPRCSNLYETGRIEEFANIIKKTLRLVIGLALPIMAGIMVLAHPLIILFCGENFLPSIPILYWDATLILFVSITGVLGIQALYSMEKVNIVICSVAAGAAIIIVLYIIFIPIYNATGAALGTFAAELGVLIVQLLLGKKHLPFNYSAVRWQNYVFATITMTAALLIIKIHTPSHISAFVQFTIGVLIGAAIYILILWWRKDELFHEMTRHFYRRKISL